MAKVAFIGLGVMGYPMAGHLVAKGGHAVTVYNRSADKAARWVAQHGARFPPHRPAPLQRLPRATVTKWPHCCAIAPWRPAFSW